MQKVICLLMLLLIYTHIKESTEVSTVIVVPQERCVTESSSQPVEAPQRGTSRQLDLPVDTDGSFKTYMDYRTITNTKSKQWLMQQEATTNEQGFRIYKDRYMVAVGTFYATECGKELEVTLSTGKTISVIVGDIKQDRHTDASNMYVPTNGNIFEFIVDTPKLNSMSRTMGDVSYSDLEGSVVCIEELHTAFSLPVLSE